MTTPANASDAYKKEITTIVSGINANNYGADPSATFAINTAAIQASFDAANAAGGGLVSIAKPGVYLIEGTLVTYSNIEFHISAGVILRQDSSASRGENGRTLLANDAYVNGSDVTISSITSVGRVCTVTTSAAHGYSVGDWAVVYGVATDGYGGIHQVTSVADTTHFTYLSHRFLDATPAVATSYTGFTTMLTRKCDENISITGSGIIDSDDVNTPNPIDILNQHGVILAAIHNLKVTDIQSINALKFCIYATGIRMVKISGVYTTGISDGIHIGGTSFDVDIFSIGTAGGDNNVAAGTWAFTGHNIFPGPVENISVRNVGQSKGLAMRIHGSAVHALRGIVFDNIRGGNNEDDVGTIQIIVDGSIVGSGVVHVVDVTISNSSSFTNTATGALTQLAIAGTVDKVTYKDTTVTFENTDQGRLITAAANAVIGDLLVQNVKLESGHSIMQADAGCTIENVYLDNVITTSKYCINSPTNDAYNIFVSNCNLSNASGSFRNTSTSGKMNIRAVNTVCTAWLVRNAAQTFIVDGTQIKADAAIIDRTDGVMFYNTNAALGTLGKAGIVLGTGTGANSWKLLEDTSLNY